MKNREGYNFPEWVTEDMKDNFFSMWDVFGRTRKDYLQGIENNNSPQNGSIQCMRKLGLRAEFIEGEFFYKWNNIGWIFDGQNVYHVQINSRKPLSQKHALTT